MRVIAIGGAPGTGKTTLMKKLVEKFQVEPKYEQVKLVPYLNKNNIYILGKYEEGQTFAGTDRMSMATQPEAVKFLATLPKNAILLYEGDRLFNSSFLEHCLDNYDLSIICLETEKNIRKERYAERGSDQNETWLVGRESKISNILSNLILMWSYEKFANNTLEEQRVVFEHILQLIEGCNEL